MAAVIAPGSDSQNPVEPSTSLSRNVTVPTGRGGIDCSTLPTSSGGSPSISAYPAPAQLSLHWFPGGADPEGAPRCRPGAGGPGACGRGRDALFVAAGAGRGGRVPRLGPGGVAPQPPPPAGGGEHNPRRGQQRPSRWVEVVEMVVV